MKDKRPITSVYEFQSRMQLCSPASLVEGMKRCPVDIKGKGAGGGLGTQPQRKKWREGTLGISRKRKKEVINTIHRTICPPSMPTAFFDNIKVMINEILKFQNAMEKESGE